MRKYIKVTVGDEKVRIRAIRKRDFIFDFIILFIYLIFSIIPIK